MRSTVSDHAADGIADSVATADLADFRDEPLRDGSTNHPGPRHDSNDERITGPGCRPQRPQGQGDQRECQDERQRKPFPRSKPRSALVRRRAGCPPTDASLCCQDPEQPFRKER